MRPDLPHIPFFRTSVTSAVAMLPAGITTVLPSITDCATSVRTRAPSRSDLLFELSISRMRSGTSGPARSTLSPGEEMITACGAASAIPAAAG